MTLRSRNRGEYLRRMAFVMLLGLAVYAIIISEKGGGATFKIWRPDRMRFALVVFIVSAVAAYEFRPQRKAASPFEPVQDPATTPSASVKQVADEPLNDSPASADQPPPDKSPSPPQLRPASPPAVASPSPVVASVPPDSASLPSGSGEAEYAEARLIPHHTIPDYSRESDGRYLDLLGQSAAHGYPLALAKLGEYAMRRQFWVESYYWMRRAQQAGMHNLGPTLKYIRTSWAIGGYPDEAMNSHRLFPLQAGSIGRALLDLDSGRQVNQSKAYLKGHAPEFLER